MEITLDLLRDYEYIRRSGVSNMFDYFNVIKVAKKCKMETLSKLSQEEYSELLMNFGKKLREFNVKQQDLI